MQEIDFSGRRFSFSDLDLILGVTKDFPTLSLTELSKTLCELLEWKRPNGKLKYEECRALLEKLQADNLISLPALHKIRCSPRRVQVTEKGNPQGAITGTIRKYEPLSLRLVQACDRQLHSLFNEFIQRYHYLGYRVPFGAHLRYLVESPTPSYLACLLFSSPAWKMAPRDAWIDWTDAQRHRNLQYVVSNSRFLILPWVSVPSLASKILSLVARQLPLDWQSLYGYRPLLLETLVDCSRFRGTSYRAAVDAWIEIMRVTVEPSRTFTSIRSAVTPGDGSVRIRLRSFVNHTTPKPEVAVCITTQTVPRVRSLPGKAAPHSTSIALELSPFSFTSSTA